MDIKRVKKAHTSKAKDAVTKGVSQAVMCGSRNASYKEIDIHKVKTADVLYACPGTTDSTKVSYNTIPDNTITVHSADIECADDNLTIEELFRSARRNFI